MENIKVPMNIREEFDASDINVGINEVENALGEAPIIADELYIPEADERTLNVVERIKETSTFYEEESDKE